MATECGVYESVYERKRLVGSLNLQVSFAKEPYNRDYILQKRPIIFRSLLIVATPYERIRVHMYWQHTATQCCSGVHESGRVRVHICQQHAATYFCGAMYKSGRNTYAYILSTYCNTLLQRRIRRRKSRCVYTLATHT